MGTTFSLSDNTTNEIITDDYYIIHNNTDKSTSLPILMDHTDDPENRLLHKLENILDDNVVDVNKTSDEEKEIIQDISSQFINDIINNAVTNVVVESQTKRKKKKKKKK